MVTHKGAGDLNQLMVEPRSLLGILFFLSKAVEVSQIDVKNGNLTVTRHDTGEPFDWKEVTGELIRISSRASRPAQAAVAVNYRGSWFYIDDSDLESKSTFSLLVQLFALQAGDKEKIMPILMLPIGK